MSSEGVYMPPSRRGSGNGSGGDGSQGGHELVVQQVKEVGVTVRYPMLSENNYGVWAVKMKIFMRAQGVWAAVEGDGVADDKQDQMALAAIVQAVLEAVVLAIAEKDMAKEAWDALKEMHIGEDRVRKANVQTLKRELERMYIEDAETIAQFVIIKQR
ncbi:hypothetical protein E2562_023708 [Oryza meyeriana var. granulata]|uniref:Uncharacterized protein n=1 Tax=Oryza meyeriana var. granulata TaxID=110450 RepID=A0A6G1BNP3_9ORYZ|nr:hypothetical protein E2562_023708 [Oryza meyeriana var. granulata]